MSQFKIRRIVAVNFKGFPKLDVQFMGSTVILGGMNGFGKTTIFDALELLLTGTIHRMEVYSDSLQNHRYARSQSQLPLVCDMSCDHVSLTAIFEIDGDRVVLRRYAKVSDMKNPVDFTPFKGLRIYRSELKKFTSITDDERSKYGLDRIKSDYSFLNYLSQEEATAFLKYKDADRSSLIQSLFDTKPYDEPIEKVTQVQLATDKIIKQNENLKSQLQKDIARLKGVSGKQGSDEYVSITVDNSEWDKVEPRLSFEDYNAWVSEGGIIDGLIYYYKNEAWLRQYNRNNAINKMLADSTLADFVFYNKYSKINENLQHFRRLKDSVLLPISTISSETVANINFTSVDILQLYVKPEILQNADILISNYKAALKSASSMQRMVQELLHARKNLAERIDNSKEGLRISRCPLCGNEYQSTTDLFTTIVDYESVLQSSFTDIEKGLSEQFSSLKQFLLENIFKTIIVSFEQIGINDNVSARYFGINPTEMNNVREILEKLHISYNGEESETDLREKLTALQNPIAEDINIELLRRMHSSYSRSLNRNVFSTESLELKRLYLISQWNKLQTKLVLQKELELKKLGNCLERLAFKKESLKKLNGELKQQRQNYVTKVISDIQVLFYVYSGRILQDSYFGRGLFLKPDIKRNRILFVSGNYQDNDVDVLYNMSSGQLVAVAISFMLSLNRLYSSTDYIAIDDPVQTIDDINLWGLMETLRHDFKDRFMLLSTHEKNYGQLLDYKFKKVGIESEYMDMAQLH